MEMPSTSMRDLAQRLLALEASSDAEANTHTYEVVRVCDKLRISLIRFAGVEGFKALMRRALVLARAEAPALESVTLDADGRLNGIEKLVATDEIESATAIIAHLLSLLATFIGEPFTLRLVREVWPDASLDGK